MPTVLFANLGSAQGMQPFTRIMLGISESLQLLPGVFALSDLRTIPNLDVDRNDHAWYSHINDDATRQVPYIPF